jgi:hypothetical protein
MILIDEGASLFAQARRHAPLLAKLAVVRREFNRRGAVSRRRCHVHLDPTNTLEWLMERESAG